MLKLVPDHIEALRRLGDLALLREDLDAAAGRYARIVELDAGDVSAITKLGVIRMRTGRRDEGMGLFRQAIERDPANAEALLYLAGALASAGRPAEALPYFERALAADPASTMALNGLGLTRLAVGDTRWRRRRIPSVAEARPEAGRHRADACGAHGSMISRIRLTLMSVSTCTVPLGQRTSRRRTVLASASPKWTRRSFAD